jgi:hypothetical protein
MGARVDLFFLISCTVQTCTPEVKRQHNKKEVRPQQNGHQKEAPPPGIEAFTPSTCGGRPSRLTTGLG